MNTARASFLLAAPIALLVTAHTRSAPNDLARLADRLIDSGDDRSAEAALREAGPRGLDVLFWRLMREDRTAEELMRVAPAIDRVAGQRYASVSKLYWYTDLDAARAEARQTGKPILSLRMLGELTDELSCANSRFFRTILYAHPGVASLLKTKFVLHWSSERDVPIMTIDFGDGRTLKRTVTGNSAHYVLDADGRVIDVIPGLATPAAFIASLDAALRSPGSGEHAARAAEIEREWSNAALMTGIAPRTLARGRGRTRVPADEAIFIAPTKAVVEAPMVVPASELARLTDDAAWAHLASFDVELAKETIALIRAENPSLDAETFERLIARLKRSIAKDTMQNEYLLHRRIHERLAQYERPSFGEMNAWVYAELFATPASDPWLGLHDDTIYTGLENAGVHRSP